jgi:hypothetical protein
MRTYFYKASIFILAAITLALPGIVSADTLYLSPSSGSYSPGQTFSARVFVSSLAQSINAVSGTVTFPTDKLQVVSVSKTNSILTLWVQDPSYSNSQGTVSFEGVVPNPGFTGSAGSIATITFRVVGQGAASLKWSSGSVLANDGSGTNILKNLNNASYSLGSSNVPAAQPAVVDEPKVDSLAPKAPKVSSSSYADSKEWYQGRQGSFSWDVDSGATAARILLGRLPASIPTVIYSPAIQSKDIADIEDGVWYFHVQLKNSHGWGAIAHYQFKVDGTKPESFSIKPVSSSDATDPSPRFAFNAADSISGIDHYTVQIDSKDIGTWRDDGTGIYEAPVLTPGNHSMSVKVYDEAGNFSDASTDFTIQGIDTPHIDSYNEQVNDSSPLIVKGTALPNTKIQITLASGDNSPYIQTVQSDEKGKFTAIFGSKLASGAYKMTAIAIDKRGAQSAPTAEKSVLVKVSWLLSLGSSLISTLALIVPILALVFVVVFIFVYGFHKIRVMRKKLRRELRGVETMVNKAFALLKEEVEDSIHLLEHTKSKRRLTEEEDAIILRLRKNLNDAEKVIHKQVEDMEREIEK